MILRFTAILLSALLTGCGGMRLVETDVNVLSTLQASALAANGGLFRFERLPSQQAQPRVQAELEAIVEAALAKTAMRRAVDPTLVRYSVLATARTSAFLLNDDGALLPIGAGHGGVQVAVGIGGPSRSLAIMWPMMGVTYLYHSEVTLLMRDLQSTQIVFETRAAHEGPWADRMVIYAAMFDAALRDFPTPPAGTRRVRIEIPR